ncbi:hypothetical protein IWW47_001529 [Coemansia sp. RSA 2052]|nr:hypothetical protein IWW47_001529 [Coemansia sp. RSA 2052]
MSAPVATISTQQSTNASYADKENWYRLDNTHQGVSYELRISHAAATGVDFGIALYSGDDVLRLFSKNFGSAVANKRPALEVGGQLAVYAKVTASYAGYSTRTGVENWPVAYIIVLEKHIAGLPAQALKLIATLVAVVLVGLFVATPRIIARINAVAAEERPKHKAS